MMNLPRLIWPTAIALSCVFTPLGTAAAAKKCDDPSRDPSAKCEPLKNNRGCVAWLKARNYDKANRWKEALLEYLNGLRDGGPCVQQASFDAIVNHPEATQPAPPVTNFEFDLATMYFNNGWWTDAEKHYAAAGKDGTEEQRKQILSGIQAARQNEVNFKIALGEMYFNNGWWKEAERHYTAAAVDGTEAQRKDAVKKIVSAHERNAKFELRQGDRYFGKGWWKEAERHYAAAAAEGTEAQREDALAKAASAHEKDVDYEFALGDIYFDKGSWKEAEKHYVAGGREGTDARREAALAKIKAAHGKCKPPDPDCNFELNLGDHYLEESAWKEAEVHFAAAGKDVSDAERKLAVDGIAKARRGSLRGSWAGGWGETFDNFREVAARAASIPGVIAILGIVALGWYPYYLFRRIVQVAPYEVSMGSEAGRPLSFAFFKARDALRTVGRPPAVFLPGIDAGVPDTLEIADLRLPLRLVSRLVKKPRVRVTADWRVGKPTGEARALIKRRRRGFSYRQVDIAHRNDIHSDAGNAQDRKLLRFAVDALTRAGRAC